MQDNFFLSEKDERAFIYLFIFKLITKLTKLKIKNINRKQRVTG